MTRLPKYQKSKTKKINSMVLKREYSTNMSIHLPHCAAMLSASILLTLRHTWHYLCKINGSSISQFPVQIYSLAQSVGERAFTVIAVTSLWARWRLKSPVSRLFTQPVIQSQIKEKGKTPRHWPWCGEFTGDRWNPAQMASYAENVSISWRHHGTGELGSWDAWVRILTTPDDVIKWKHFPHTTASDAELWWFHFFDLHLNKRISKPWWGW